MAKKYGLGRGLDALFADNAVDENITTLAISELEPNANQPRRHFDEAALSELADSISIHGVLQPILVRPMPAGQYQIVAGERRWRASRLAGLTAVPVQIRELSDNETAELALIENLQREDLNAIEEARGYKSLIEEFSLSQEQVAERVGKSRPAVANAMRLLVLDDDLQNMVVLGDISAGHARAMLAMESRELRLLAAAAAKKGASVRELERMAKQKPATKAEPKPAAAKPTYFSEAELSLSETLGRRVKVSPSGEGGSITIEFFNKDDLSFLANRLGGKE